MTTKKKSIKQKEIDKLYKKADDSFTNYQAIELDKDEEIGEGTDEIFYHSSDRCEVTFEGKKTLSTRYLFTTSFLKEGTKLSLLSDGKVLKKVAKFLEKGDKVIVSKNENGHWRINLAE